jgi:hypothetical protein
MADVDDRDISTGDKLSRYDQDKKGFREVLAGFEQKIWKAWN